jgi:hypothetical protein
MHDVRLDAAVADDAREAFAPVFIVGAHRSGTSALYGMLAETGAFAYFSAGDIVAINAGREGRSEEAAVEALARVCEVLPSRLIDPTPITPDFPEEYGFVLPGRRLAPETVDLFRAACLRIAREQKRRRVLLKNPWDIDRLGFIKRAFPDARFVVIHRHPADVVASQRNALRTLILHGSAYHDLIDPRSGTRRVPLAGRLLLRVPGAMAVFAAVLMVRLRLRLARLTAGLAALDPADFIEIRFEDLAAAQPGVLGRVHAFLGLPPPTNGQGFHAGRNHGQNRFHSRIARAFLSDYARRYRY